MTTPAQLHAAMTSMTSLTVSDATHAIRVGQVHGLIQVGRRGGGRRAAVQLGVTSIANFALIHACLQPVAQAHKRVTVVRALEPILSFPRPTLFDAALNGRAFGAAFEALLLLAATDREAYRQVQTRKLGVVVVPKKPSAVIFYHNAGSCFMRVYRQPREHDAPEPRPNFGEQATTMDYNVVCFLADLAADSLRATAPQEVTQ